MEDGGLEKPNRLHESTSSASHCPPWIRERKGNGRAQGRGEDQVKVGALEKAQAWSERLQDTERERMGRKTKQNKKPWLLHSSCLPLSCHFYPLTKTSQRWADHRPFPLIHSQQGGCENWIWQQSGLDGTLQFSLPFFCGYTVILSPHQRAVIQSKNMEL